MTPSHLLILAALTLSSAAAAATTSPLTKAPRDLLKSNPHTSIERNAYFVVFNSEPGTGKAQREQAAFQQTVKNMDSVKIRKQFNTLVNAASVTALKQDLPDLAKHPSVKSIMPMLTHTPPKVIRKDVNDPALKYSHSITGVAEVQKKLGFTGVGVKVGIIDSGIDYTHPALGGCFGKGCKVAYGYDFVGLNYTGKNEPVSGGDVRDVCNGHGTHVAGIVAAKHKDLTGVAPDVTLGAYRVFGCNGSTANDIIISAMEKAYLDGMDVINLSLGGSSSWPGYPDAIVADRLTEKGVVVVAAMGNDGEKGSWEASSPAVSNSAIGVASIDNVRYNANGLTVVDQNVSFDYTSSGEGFVFPLRSATVVSGKNSTGSDLSCVPYPPNTFTGKVVLSQRGECTFNEKAQHLQEAGAIGALFYNKEFGAFGPQITDGNVTIPCVGMTQDYGRRLLGLIEASSKKAVDVVFPEKQLVFDNPTGGKVSSFSSWGPGPGLEMKPDFAAPGGLVFSTYPMTMGQNATLSGTSMATPYVTGAVALYIQAVGKRHPVEIREKFRSTANPTTTFGTNNLAPVQHQGGGLINVKSAITSTTLVSPSMFPLLSTDTSVPRSQLLRVRNFAKTTMSYELSHRPALSVQPWDPKDGELSTNPLTKEASAKVNFSVKAFKLQPGEARDIKVTFEEPALPIRENYLYGGYIVVKPKLSTPYAQPEQLPTEITIPYSGFRGNYKTVSIFSRPESGLPTLFDVRKAMPITKKDPKALFTLKDEDMPVVAVRLAHPCKKILVTVFDSNKRELGQVVGGEDENLGRNDSSESNLSIPVTFNGMIQALGSKSEKAAAPAPDGDYLIRVSVLRPFGKEQDPRDWQRWESPIFTIDRTKEPVDVLSDLNNSTSIADRINGWFNKRLVHRPVIEGSSIENSVLPRPFRIVEQEA